MNVENAPRLAVGPSGVAVKNQMNDNETAMQHRLRQIAASRTALTERAAADPDGAERTNARMTHFATPRRRRRQRVVHPVLGEKWSEPRIARPEAMS